MIRDHKFYEMQSALAATGQLTDAELTELEQHATTCASCHEYLADMAEMGREFFLWQAMRMKSKGTPAGMQERFLERAAGAGILVNRSTFTPLAHRFARVAVVALLLAISASLSWRVFSAVPDMERDAVQAFSAAGSQPVLTSYSTAPIAGERAIHHVPISKARLRPRSASAHSTISISSAHGITAERQSEFELDRPLFARQGSRGNAFWSHRLAASPLSTGLHTPILASFTDAYVASCFERKEDCKPEGRAFHLELKLASVSFLDAPQSINAGSHITSPRFSAPVFHLDPSRVW